MKMEAERAPTFRPVKVTFVIETNQEYEMLKAMTALDEDIPLAVAREANAEAAYGVAQSFLQCLRALLLV